MVALLLPHALLGCFEIRIRSYPFLPAQNISLTELCAGTQHHAGVHRTRHIR